MPDRFTNLLPLERQRSLAREYYMRLGVVALVLFSALVGAAMVLLVPTYVFLAGNASVKEARLASMKSTLSSSDEVALAARLAALSDEVSLLTVLAGTPSVSATVRAVLAVPHPRVILHGFTYTQPAGKKAGTLGLSGVAATRDALRAYQLALQSAPFALSAELPVSVYAKDTDIAFTITVTLAP